MSSSSSTRNSDQQLEQGEQILTQLDENEARWGWNTYDTHDAGHENGSADSVGNNNDEVQALKSLVASLEVSCAANYDQMRAKHEELERSLDENLKLRTHNRKLQEDVDRLRVRLNKSLNIQYTQERELEEAKTALQARQ